LNQEGEILLHRHRQAGPEPLLQALAPYREDLVVCVECLFTWSWLADLCAREGIAFVLGHALSMKAIHGGKAKHEKIDAHKMVLLRRGGMLPQASVYPAEMRATRDLLRRRMQLMRQRAELLAHIQHTTSQDNLPEIGTKLADKANRQGVAQRFPEPAVQTSIEVDLALVDHDDSLRRDVELCLLKTAQQPDSHTLSLLRTIPGIGESLSVVLRYAIHDLQRFPRVQDFVSSCRLVTCARESAGKRYGTSETKMGHAALKWAVSEAAALFLRTTPAGQKDRARLEKHHGNGNALTILAHT
jgi:transposase